MKIKNKKILLTVIDIVVLLLALYWVLWLMVYFVQSIDGAIVVHGKYNIFERNYLVPLQIFGITVFSSIFSVKTYNKLHRKNLIGRKYIILVVLHILPFGYISVMQVLHMIYYRYIY